MKKKRKLKAILCIIVILIIIISQIMTSYAMGAEIALILGIAPEAVLAIALTLIAAGLTMYTLPQVYTLVTDYYNQATPEIRTWLSNVTSGTVTLTDEIWQSIRSFVQTKFTAAGVTTVYSANIPIAMNFTDLYGNRVDISTLPVNTDNISVVIGDRTAGNGDYYAYFFTSWYMYNSGVDSTTNIFTVYNARGAGAIYHYDKVAKTWSQMTNAYYGWSFWIGENIYYYAQPGTYTLRDCKSTYEDLLGRGCPVIGYNMPKVMAQPVVTNPTWDWTNANTGNRDIIIPDVTVENIDTVVTPYLDKTMDDIITQTVVPTSGTTSIDLTPTNSILQNIYDGIMAIPTILQNIYTGILSIPQSISNIYDKLFEPINTGTLVESIKSKFEIDRLQTSWNLLQNMDTSQGAPPVFKVNLNQLFNTTSTISGKANVFPAGDTVLLDFAEFEKYSFMGMNLTQLIRTIITTGFILTTFGYVSRKFAPDKIIGGGS